MAKISDLNVLEPGSIGRILLRWFTGICWHSCQLTRLQSFDRKQCVACLKLMHARCEKNPGKAGNLNSPGQPSNFQQEPNTAIHLTQRLRGSDASSSKETKQHMQATRTVIPCSQASALFSAGCSYWFSLFWFWVFASQHWLHKRSSSQGLMHLTHDASSTEGRVEALYRRPLPRCKPLPPLPFAWLAPPSPLPLQTRQRRPQCTQHNNGPHIIPITVSHLHSGGAEVAVAMGIGGRIPKPTI